MNGYWVKLIVTMMNGGGTPFPRRMLLEARVQQLRQAGSDAKALEEAENAVANAARESREIARFTRTVVLPAPPSMGLTLTCVGPFVFEPDTVLFNAHTSQYEMIEVGYLCHMQGSECGCQKMVKAYMDDDEWEMLAIYEPDADEQAPSTDEDAPTDEATTEDDAGDS